MGSLKEWKLQIARPGRELQMQSSRYSIFRQSRHLTHLPVLGVVDRLLPSNRKRSFSAKPSDTRDSATGEYDWGTGLFPESPLAASLPGESRPEAARATCTAAGFAERKHQSEGFSVGPCSMHASYEPPSILVCKELCQ